MKQTTTTDTIKEFEKRFPVINEESHWAEELKDWILSAISKTREETIEEIVNKKGIPCEKHKQIFGHISLECRACINNLKEKQIKV